MGVLRAFLTHFLVGILFLKKRVKAIIEHVDNGFACPMEQNGGRRRYFRRQTRLRAFTFRIHYVDPVRQLLSMCDVVVID